MAENPLHTHTLERLREEGIVRPRDLESVGISRSALRRLVERGEAERIARGLYLITGADITEHHTLASVAKRVPRGIVCLLTALRYHEIGTQSPNEVWMAIDRKARKPRLDDLPVRFVRFSGAALTYGVQRIEVEGVPTRITSPARTIVDCFRYRNKIGLDVALEALRDGLRSRIATVDEIWRAAEACRALNVMRPYVEAVD